MENYARKSLEGLWVGDCIGNLGQLYFAHDILKALETGLAKFGGALGQFHKQFQYSDDTEEGIVLYNHILTAKNEERFDPIIDQDRLAMEFATRYWTRDPDGEIYGYGLNTRKVLRDIYEGVPWKEANLIIKKSEGMPSHIDSLVDSLSKGKGFKDAMKDVNTALDKQREEQLGKTKEGSCGNGSAMRVAPLGAFMGQHFASDGYVDPTYQISYGERKLIVEAYRQAEVTHCHPEGLFGSIAIAGLARLVTKQLLLPTEKMSTDMMYDDLLRIVPDGQVKEGIKKAQSMKFDVPLQKVIEILGNGTHVTCQDTVPLCCYMALKHLSLDKVEEMYEKAIIETSMCFGDVDTNCAIVGGIVGIVSPPPQKWVDFCQPMEGVIDNTVEEHKKADTSAMAHKFQRLAGIA